MKSPYQSADASLGRTVGDIEQHDLVTARKRHVDEMLDVCVMKHFQINQRDFLFRLFGQVESNIRLSHRSDRMAAHHGMPVDAVVLPLIGGEKIAERRVALQLGGAYNEGDARLLKELLTDVYCAPDAANRRTRVKSRAYLVVTDRRPKAFQPSKRRREMLVHPSGRLAAA